MRNKKIFIYKTMERRVRGNLHARCGVGENLEIISKDYLSLFLNSIAFDRERTSEKGNIDETRLPLLKQILDETGALIVLSSSWRKHWDKEPSLCDDLGAEINSIFAIYDIAIYDKTPQLQSNDRAEEIRLWLSQNETVRTFVILDDISFGWGLDLQDNLVKTNCRIGRGLERQHVQKAIEILNS